MRKGAIAEPIPIGQPTALTAADLERLREPRYVASTPQKLRDSHHMIARLAATGLREFKIAEATGYSRVRVLQLLDSPAMQELVAQYRAKVDDTFVEGVDQFFSLATQNMLAAERHIADHIAELDEQGELLPVRTALAISRDAADRFGYGKKTQNLNINVDFASQLERAIKRSGKQIDGVSGVPSPRHQEGRQLHSASPHAIEGAASPPTQRREPARVGSSRTEASLAANSPQPRILRRA